MKKYYSKFIIFFLFCVVSITASLYWSSGHEFINGTDSFYSLNKNDNYLNLYISSWNDLKSTGNYVTNQSRIFFGLIDYAIDDARYVFLITNYFLVFSSLFWCYLFLNLFVKNKWLNVLMSIVYTFGPFEYYYVWQDQTGFQWLMAFLPAYFFCLHKLYYENVEKNDNWYYVLIFIISLIYGTSLSHIFLLVSFILTIFFVLPLFLNKFSIVSFLKKSLIISLLFFWIFFPYSFVTNNYLYSHTQDIKQSADFIKNSKYSDLIHTLTQTSYKNINSLYIGGFYPVNEESFYYKNTTFFTLSVLIIAIIVFGLFFIKNNKRNYYIFLVFLFVLFLISNLFLSQKAVFIDKFSLLAAFRNVFSKFAIAYELLLVLLLSISLNNIYKKILGYYEKVFFVFFVFLISILYIFPFLISTPIFRGKGALLSYYVSVPNDYRAFYLNSNSNKYNSKRILVLPIQYYGVGFSSWIRKDNNVPLGEFSNNAIINLKFDENSLFLVQNISVYIKEGNYDDFLKFLQEYEINYIVFDDNQNWELWDSLYWKDPNIPSHRNYEDLFLYLKTKNYPIGTYGKIKEVKITSENSFLNLIDRNGLKSKINHNKMQPYLYKLKLSKNVCSSNLDAGIINFNQTYNKGWKIYSGDKLSLLNLFVPFDINYLTNNNKYNNFSNSWDLAKICEKNKTDSVYLFFKPQSYIFFSFIVSLITALIFLIKIVSRKK